MRLPAFLRAERTRDTAWALLDQGFALLSSTLSFLLLGRTLGSQGYGAFVGLYGLIGPFTPLGQVGVYFTVMEHIAREGEDPADVARSCLSITALNAALWVPLLSAASLLWIQGIPTIAAILIIGTEFCLTGVLVTLLGIVQAMVGFRAAARLRIASSLLRIGLLVALAATGSLTLTTLAVGQVATIGAVVIVTVTTVSRLIGATVRPGRIRSGHVRSVLLYGLQIGASNVQGDGDKFVLNATHHQADAGRYGAATRLMQFALLPLLALLNAVHLSFLRTTDDANSQLRRAIRTSLAALAYAVPAALGLFLLAPLVPRILSKDFGETTSMLQLLAPLVILRGLSSFPMNGLMGLGRNKLRTKLVVGHGLLSLALYAALIPRYSWRGALAATLATELSLAASGWIALVLCERGSRTPPGPAELAR